MRILLDEDLPRRFATLLVGHEVSTVQQRGWAGIKNGKLLGLAGAEFDVFVTMDSNLEYQQNLASLPIAVLVMKASSNRMEHLVPLVSKVLQEQGVSSRIVASVDNGVRHEWHLLSRP